MRVLIVSPHMDDEVLGCSSWLKEADVSVVYSTRTHPTYPNVAEENDELAERLGFKRLWLSDDRINRLDTLPIAQLINELEEFIELVKPDTALVPAPSYNQDHRTIFDAALTACRAHDRNFFVRRVLAYEQPETWGTMRSPQFFHPTYFRKLSMPLKLSYYKIYTSQIRAHRSEEHVQALARFRGMQCNMEFAEAFEVLRWVE